MQQRSTGSKCGHHAGGDREGDCASCVIINFMTNEGLIQFWKESAEDALNTAQELNKPGNYHHSLFFLHLAIEKILKAVYVKKRGETPPPIHDLVRLVEDAGLPMDEERTKELVEISSFNISARYERCANCCSKLCPKGFFVRSPCVGRHSFWILG